jgi:hypothetical protein
MVIVLTRACAFVGLGEDRRAMACEAGRHNGPATWASRARHFRHAADLHSRTVKQDGTNAVTRTKTPALLSA